MSFFNIGIYNRGNRDNMGNRRNWNIGQNVGWKRGRNKRLRFSIHFDVDSKEFNQLLQTGFLNLTRQGNFQPHHNIVGIPLETYVSM